MNGVVYAARRVHVHGVVQGVGFRPFVFQLANSLELTGWVMNGPAGVEIHVEGAEDALDRFSQLLWDDAPPHARIAGVETRPAALGGFGLFSIQESFRGAAPHVRVTPDLAICDDCLRELFDPLDRRARYPYISCSNCGPRYSIITALPYDRAFTSMAVWPMCAECRREYHDPATRRFHAQPIACHNCGPNYVLLKDRVVKARRCDAIRAAAAMLERGAIVAIKGLGGYHLACDATNRLAVARLRSRKFRKEKPFALMAREVAIARSAIDLSAEGEALLVSPARPIVLGAARVSLPEVAPESNQLGVMVPYTPLHHLLYAEGAPPLLVMTSANHSSDPIAYEDEDALERLAGVSDAFLVGERAIARRVDDSVVQLGPLGPAIIRRGRGYTPTAVARLPLHHSALAVGADLKNTVTLVVGGEAFVSQHIGDLEHTASFRAFEETVRDLSAMHQVNVEELVIAHDLHPQFASTAFAAGLPARQRCGIQHHRAHVASVLAERGCFDQSVLGVAFDGTGYGDDGSIWGGEFFVGSIAGGLSRVAHLRAASLPGGDAAARYPVQAAAGFLSQLETLPDLRAAPFFFPNRFQQACSLIEKQLRTFPTTSAGRLFDTVAALLGFTRENTFEGQAAVWLEQLASKGTLIDIPVIPFDDGTLDFRPALQAVIEARLKGHADNDIARAFHYSLARGIAAAARQICENHQLDIVVLSGGVFQNELLVEYITKELQPRRRLWTNRLVPANDGGISLGQAALLLQQLC